MRLAPQVTPRELLDRYGPSLAVIAVLVMLVVLLPSNTRDQERISAGLGPTQPNFGGAGDDTLDAGAVGGEAAAGGPAIGGGPGRRAGPSGGGPIPLDTSALESGGVRDVVIETESGTWGPGIFPEAPPGTCRVDGRLPGFSFYQPRCAPVFRGDNGGATWKGVTADTVKVARLYGPVDPGTQAALRALNAADTRTTAKRVDNALIHYYNNHVETYGREVVWDDRNASGNASNDEKARADAAQLAADGYFAVWPSVATDVNETTLAQELAARGVMCFCTASNPRPYYQRNSPYVWSSLPILEEYYEHLAEYIGKRLAGKTAKWAGDPTLTARQRKFGLIYVNGNRDRINAEADDAARYFQSLLAGYGVGLVTQSYTYDPPANAQNAPTYLAKMKDAGVTTLLCFCDPLIPVHFYKAATGLQYYPEHLITGAILMDTTFFGRTYDQAQWRNAFGISPLWVFFTDVSRSSGYVSYYHGDPGPRSRPECDPDPCEGVGINVRQAPIQLMMNGTMYSGPYLTPGNFALGFYRAGRSGGVPHAPLVYFTPESHTAIKDFTEVWWSNCTRRTDVPCAGTDETGREGQGVLLKAAAGTRYELGEWPVADPYAFTDDPRPVFTSDTPPQIFPHADDGHTHGKFNSPTAPACRSCPPTLKNRWT